MSENKNTSKPSESTSSSKSGDDVIFYSHKKDAAKKTAIPQKSASSTEKEKTVSGRGRRGASYKLSKKRVVLNVLACILASAMILGGCGCIFAYTVFHSLNYKEITVDDPDHNPQTSYINHDVAPIQESNSENVKTYDGDLLNDPMVLNIMLFGEDTRQGQVTGQSDTMVIFSIDTRHKKLKMLSLMRDTYVEIPGYGENRLNAAYTIGGPALTISAIQKNYGIKIDRYAVVDFTSFKKIIDTLGGIDVELTSEEIDYINWQCWKNNQVETRNELDVNSYTFKPNAEGVPVATVHLNGRQALWHARNRGQDGICSGDDFTRTQRQRNVINIIIDRMRNVDIPTLLQIIYDIGPLITTNIKTSEITSLAADISTYLSYNIVSQSAPMSDQYGTMFYFSDDDHPIFISGMWASVILIYDWDQFRQQVAEFIYEEQVAPQTSQ